MKCFEYVTLLLVAQAHALSNPWCQRLRNAHQAACSEQEILSSTSTDDQSQAIPDTSNSAVMTLEMAGLGLRNYSREVEVLSILLETLTAKVKRLGSETPTNICQMVYKGKCFWVETGFDGIGCDYARKICVSQGGRMADIYSEDHYYMMTANMRQFASAVGFFHAWIGMTYDRETQSVRLSNGTAAPFVKWHPGLPHEDDAYCCCMAISIDQKWTSLDQHMFNARSEGLRGVICER